MKIAAHRRAAGRDASLRKRGRNGTSASSTSGDCDRQSHAGYLARLGRMLPAEKISAPYPERHGAPYQDALSEAIAIAAGRAAALNIATRIQRSRRGKPRDETTTCARKMSGRIGRFGRTR